MSSPLVAKLNKEDSLEEFEFCDFEGDLDVDLSKSPVHGAVEKLGTGVSLVFSALCTITEEQGLVVTIPVKAMATTAASAIAGTILGGAPGLAVGLITGAVVAYRTSPNRCKSPNSNSRSGTSLRQVFRQMSLQQKKDLLKDMLSCLKQSNVRALIVEILKNEEIRNMALGILSNFLMKRMGISLARAKA